MHTEKLICLIENATELDLDDHQKESMALLKLLVLSDQFMENQELGIDEAFVD